MNTEIRFNPSLSPATTTQADVSLGQAAAGAANQVAPLLNGTSLTVTTASMGDLEKLVARLKSESQNTRLSLVLSSLTSLNESLTEAQKANLARLDALDQQLTQLDGLLDEQNAALSAEEANSLLLEAKIASLEKAVERAVQEGKEHNEAVQKAKAVRDADQAKLDQLKNAAKKDEAAIAAAETALAASQAKLDEAVAVQKADAATIAAAQTDLAAAQKLKAVSDTKIALLKVAIAGTQSQIASVKTEINSCLSAIGDKTLADIAAALQKTAQSFSDAEEAPSAADERKAAKKEEATNPLNIIRDALDRLDEAMAETIGANRETMV